MTVVLEASYGDDLAIVNAARVSYAKNSRLEDDGSLNGADAGLINYLMKNRHGTPFEMVDFRFRVKVPIGVGREWMRHRIGSFNEVSTRYVEMQPDFYIPSFADVRVQVGKPGHYTFETADFGTAEATVTEMRAAYSMAYNAYRELLKLGVAKELARNVLPLGLLTEFIWKVNLRSLLNFLALRTHPTALLEIRVEAQEIERLVRDIVPVAMKSWDDNGKVAP